PAPVQSGKRNSLGKLSEEWKRNARIEKETLVQLVASSCLRGGERVVSRPCSVVWGTRGRGSGRVRWRRKANIMVSIVERLAETAVIVQAEWLVADNVASL